MLPVVIAANIQQAIDSRSPVVALESTVIAHGLPTPCNSEVALACEAAVRARGATPATIAILDGRIVIGCDADQIHFLARGTNIAKISRRDLAAVIARRGNGATTVAGTLLCAAAAGIRVMATGGIGGVHRGGETSMDISADLQELARAPLAVVCAGAKSILDLGRTLEVLETNGVPIAGFGTDHFPAFYSQESGFPVEIRVNTATEAADLIAAHQSIPDAGGIVIANPVPADAAIPSRDVEKWILNALMEAQGSGVSGKDLTPFLLSSLTRLSSGATLESNIALLENNASVAAEIAVALHAI